MNYSISTLLRAAVAGVLALGGAVSAGANGVDISHLDLGQWLAAIGTALVAAAAIFHKPGEKTDPITKANSTVTDVVTSAVEAHQSLTQQAVDSIKAVQQATGDLTSLLPTPVAAPVQATENLIVHEVEKVLGPLATRVIGLI